MRTQIGLSIVDGKMSFITDCWEVVLCQCGKAKLYEVTPMEIRFIKTFDNVKLAIEEGLKWT